VTVAVLKQERSVDPKFSQIDESDFSISWYSGTGKGGQKRNKSQSCCRVTHIPTGLQEARQGRSRNKNYDDARDALLARLAATESGAAHTDMAADRKTQVGSGMRADKVITIQFQNDLAKHHSNDTVMSARKFMKGYMDKLFV
jgi:peptide chain release factor 1